MSDTALGTAFDICGAEVADVCAVSDTCPLGRSVHLVLTDTCAAAGGQVARLSATPAEVSDTAPARGVEVSARCVRLSGLSATVSQVSDRFCTPGGAQSR